ncbi:MAG: hypothetical protein GY952_18015 [Rhodobacteraceae bacterium]|nr:hypothetical protein [Paracoccaceae bacterium]
MFNPEIYGLNTDFITTHMSGGVAPTRFALKKQQYLEQRRQRLKGEAAERRHRSFQFVAQGASFVSHKLMMTVRTALEAASIKFDALSR